MNTVVTVLIGILGLGFLIFFHETGHFLAARLFGVHVEAFSVGMGPVLLHKNVKGTDFRLSLIPLGGYCSMKGEQDYSRDSDYKSLDKDSFYGVHPFKRLLIAFAGPFFNLIFAFIAFILVAGIGFKYYSAGTRVIMTDEVSEIHSPAHEAGLETGDVILSVDGKSVDDFSEVYELVATHPDKDLLIQVERKGEILSFVVHSDLDKETGLGRIGIQSDTDTVQEREYKADSFFKAIVLGAKKTGNFISVTFTSFGTLFKGVKITNAVSGPARITTMIGSTVKEGFKYSFRVGVVSTLELLAMISVALFITNLLPLPVLDGGLIIFALLQIITGKRLNPKIQLYIQYAGIVIIAALFLLAITGDVLYFIKK